MGTWGYKLYEDDSFCEVVESFQSKLKEGIKAEQVLQQIESEFDGEISDSLLQLAIAESLWRINSITEDALHRVNSIIQTGEDIEYWKNLGADETFVARRAAELNAFYKRIQTPPLPSQKWKIDKAASALSRGTCFWYKNCGSIYGAVVLEVQQHMNNYYLIALTEKLASVPQKVSEILASALYTVAWFGEVDLLTAKRMHVVGSLNITVNYINRYGLQIEVNRKVSLTNCGQAHTWAHRFRAISFRECNVGDFV